MRQESLLYDGSPGPKVFVDWLKKNRQCIKLEWADRLSNLSPAYREQKRSELTQTVTRAFQANLEYICSCDLSKIKRFIDYITNRRLKSGFPLSDVQKAFELFRMIVFRKLVEEGNSQLLTDSLDCVNGCLSYTIHRFSDHYQHLHERSILEHTKNLEQAIRERSAELVESENRYKTLVEEINDGYFIIQNKRIMFANRAFCSMHRINPRMVVGRPFSDFVSTKTLPVVLKSYLDLMKGGKGYGPVQYQIKDEPNETSYREVRARVSDLGSGPVLIGICRDISERVSMEAKVREHERLAYLGRLSASLSHEIRNPLSSIKMNLQILERKLDLDGYDLRRLQISVNEVTRLEDILRQLLDTARPLTLDRSPEDLSSIAKKCVEVLEPKASEKELFLVQSFSRKRPVLELDSARIQQAVINLLLNAIEASPPGGRISIWTKMIKNRGRGFLELGVGDNGPGIQPDQAQRLFTQFNTSKSLGSGLGLSNVKRIVEAHSGSVAFRKPRGPGAIFAMRFPIPDQVIK